MSISDFFKSVTCVLVFFVFMTVMMMEVIMMMMEVVMMVVGMRIFKNMHLSIFTLLAMS